MIDLLRVLCQLYQNDLVAKVMAAILYFEKKILTYFTQIYSFNILTLLEVPYPAFTKFATTLYLKGNHLYSLTCIVMF